MIFKQAKLKDAYIIQLEKHDDERGFFAQAWCRKEFESHGLNPHVVQANIALSRKSGTLRGLHYQLPPYEEAKLVRCIRGAIYDVMIDLRKDSSTFKQWVGQELTSEDYQMLYIPEGFAHGYFTLVDNTEVFYQVSKFYAPNYESGVRWDDPAFDIKWPAANDLIVTDKDKNWPDFQP